MPDQPPLIFVDLIEEHPLPRVEGSTMTDEKYKAYVERFQPFRIVIKSGDNHRPLFRSTERYFNKADAIHAAELAFGHASTVYLREAETGNQLLRMAQP